MGNMYNFEEEKNFIIKSDRNRYFREIVKQCKDFIIRLKSDNILQIIQFNYYFQELGSIN